MSTAEVILACVAIGCTTLVALVYLGLRYGKTTTTKENDK